MQAKLYLKDYAKRADKFLARFFDKKIEEVRDVGEDGKGITIAVDMLTRYKNFIRGGKKLRGALIQLGYEISGGEKNKVLQASTSIEIIHSFLLMHDDIMDLDVTRRGFPTVHKQYEKETKKFKISNDPVHFGVSMGINVGDVGSFLGTEVLLASNLPSDRKIEAGTYLLRLLQRTTYGQGLDVIYEQMKNISEEDVMQVHLHKTAFYTISGPIKIGALLGGLSKKKIENIEKFGRPVGIAFQLKDDELGLFSEEGTLGKSIGSDIREGKNTILRIKAFEKAKKDDKKFLKYAYGNRKITKSDVKIVQQITVASGAFEYSRNLSQKLIERGKKYIPQITKDRKLQDTLASISDFVIARKS